jgi:hypothetical protein
VKNNLALIVVFLLFAMSPAQAETPNPTITGPIKSEGFPGVAAHNYTFFATNHDLATLGYVEEEFFIQGTANRYDTPAQATGTVVEKDHPYKTRIVVRRPANAKRFNGTVLVEWYNVTNNFDAENMWFFAWEQMLRAGYAWVGVSTQQAGVAALKTFSMERYGSMDVNHGGTVGMDALSYDIFSQGRPGDQEIKRIGCVGRAQAGPCACNRRVAVRQSAFHLCEFHSSSCRCFRWLRTVVHAEPEDPHRYARTRLEDFGGVRCRSREASARQPDTNLFRSWEIAGTAHVDQHLRSNREPLELRDIGTSSEAAMSPRCGIPTVGTRTPMHYVIAAALDLMVRWVDKKALPPAAPPLTATSTTRPIALSRDAHGLATGGIRLADVAVPIGLNKGTNTGPGACARWGYYQSFDIDTLHKLYPNHQAYVTAVERVTNENLKAGYILKADADRAIRAAKESSIGSQEE